MDCKERNLEQKALKLLGMFPAIAFIGARQVGKSTLAKVLGNTEGKVWKYMDLESPRDYERIAADPEFFFEQYPQNLIIDEAQLYPTLFEVLRGVIDKHRMQKGRFILTGSSSPELMSQISESLAGRIGILHLGTLKANEYYQLPLSPFYKIFDDKLDPQKIPFGDPPLSRSKIQSHWLKGGYPEPRLDNNPLFYEQWMDHYRSTYVNRDIARLFPRLNRRNYQRFLMILSKLSGTIINKSDVARALEVNESTVREYISIAEGTFLWRSLPSFEKNVIKSIIKMPKGYIRDTGLLHHLTRISSPEELFNDPSVGSSFEGFVIEEIIKGIESAFITNWQPYYYRTRNGAEIDLILDGPFGTLPIEIKYGSSVSMRQLRPMSNFIEEHNLPFGIVINQSTSTEWLTPKIAQLPVGWI